MGDPRHMALDKRTFALGVVLAFVATAFTGCLSGNNGGGTTNLELKLGLMAPLTGDLATLGPDMLSGMKMAVDDVNNANVGIHITTYQEDDGTGDSAGAPAKFQRLVGNGVTAIAGPCCSGVTAALLDSAVTSQVVISTPSATSPSLQTGKNQGFFWRVPPSDALQGKVLAKLVSTDGVKTVSMIIVNNAYGNGLSAVFKDAFLAAGGVVTTISKHDESANTYSSQVTEACLGAVAGQAVVIVDYTAAGGAILKEMQAQGCLSKVKVYGSEGIYDAAGGLAKAAGNGADGKSLAVGVKGTHPQALDTKAYTDKFKAKYNKAPNLYSAESYDAVIYVALAAVKAKSVSGKDIAANMLDIANSPGTKGQDFATLAKAVQGGSDVDYQGYGHDFDFDANHEPKTGLYAYWIVNDDGSVKDTQTGVSA